MVKETTSSLDPIRKFIRSIYREFARFLIYISGNKITPNMVTITGLIAHLPIALFIITGHTVWAGILLIIFGLFDTLDGELARLSHQESARGMFLDAVTDRYKEVILYTAIGYYLIKIDQPYLAVWAILACGASISISYVKAKGEAVYLGQVDAKAKVFGSFKDGLMRFEVRMVVLILGLLTSYVGAAVVIIAILSTYTSLSRLIKVNKDLDV